MISLVQSALLLLAVSILSPANAATDPDIVGTWSSKSKTVVTGPDFYDPVTEEMKEPRLPGTSYSFTEDGHFEAAAYLVVSNPGNPSCPSAYIQWQHGDYTLHDNGSLTLTPIKVDGRQLMSNACEYKNSIYTRYNQTEYYKRYEVYTDGYRNERRLNLFRFDGSPMNPMYLVYRPPQMLPTQTLNPTSTAGGAKATGKVRLKRDLPRPVQNIDDKWIDRWWWTGLTFTILGFIGAFCV